MAENIDTVGTAPARIGIVGGGWRAEYFLRVASLLPERFTVARVLVRSESSAARVEARWAVRATTSLTAFARETYDFVIVSTPRESAGELTLHLVRAGAAVLTETPPAVDLAQLVDLYKRVAGAPVQVAEQYGFQPHHAARLAVVRSGLIGTPSSARSTVAHGYHGVSLLRLALGVGFEPVTVSAQRYPDPVLSLAGREGWDAHPQIVANDRVTALLGFAESSAVYDFAEEQYFSPLRSRQFTVRGTRGEIDNNDVRYFVEPGRAAFVSLRREVTGVDGDLEGSFLARISLGAESLVENRFAPARLSDDEIAVAEVMHRMAIFVRTGEQFYGLADASHDHYVALLIEEAAATGRTMHSASQPWSDDPSVATR